MRPVRERAWARRHAVGVGAACVALCLTAAQAAAQADSLTTRQQVAVQRYERGERDAAFREFGRFVDIYNASQGRLSSRELVAVAIACTYLGVRDPQAFKDALRAFDEAIVRDPDNMDARARLAELFLAKYNSADAQRTLREALARDADYVPALVAEARRRVFDGERGADSVLARALALAPDNVAARVLNARFRADAEDWAGANAEIERALRVAPADGNALAFGAAVRAALGDSSAAADLARRYAEHYPREAGVQVARAELLGRVRQYAAAAAAAREGVGRDSTSWAAYRHLGMNLLRLGDVADAKRNLEIAFAGDPYDVWTKNTLDLLDTFGEYDELTTERFRFVMEKPESQLLALYLEPLADSAYRVFSAKYGFRPAGPVRVEVYRSHADFSVRTVGLAGLGALGVSFGNTVAFDSPAAKDAGRFTWGSTAWHELAHTFTLGASGNRVPRWLSEGLSVYEERRARKGWGQHVTPAFLEAYAGGKLLPVSRLNDGFVRPAYPRQVIFSYYQASLVCEMIARDYGESTLAAMLRAYASGYSTEQVVRRVLRTDPGALDRRFDAYMRERFPAVQVMLATYERQLDSAGALIDAGQTAAAIALLQRARAAFPEYGGAESAHALLARAYLAGGDRRQAAEALTAMIARGEATRESHVTLADLLLQQGDTAGAADALEGAMFVDPYSVADHERLAALYTALGNRTKAVRERRAVVALKPVDVAEAWYQLALAYRAAGDLARARTSVLRSLEQAPHFERAQDLLLALRGQRGGGTP